ALGMDLDVLVELVEVIHDRLHRRPRRRVRLGVPRRDHDLLLGAGWLAAAEHRGRRRPRRRRAQAPEELAPPEGSLLALRDETPEIRVSVPLPHDSVLPLATGSYGRARWRDDGWGPHPLSTDLRLSERGSPGAPPARRGRRT